jgi:hypothetical protein
MTTSHTKGSKLTSSIESDLDELISKFEELSRLYNLERKRAFEYVQAKAYYVISMIFSPDEKSAKGEI